jgi:hypothetical protein
MAMSSTRSHRFAMPLLAGFAVLAAGRLYSGEATPLHAERTFAVRLNATRSQAVPLFDPLGEREWSPSWNPKIIFPADGSSPTKGSVFTTSDKNGEEIWVVTDYDTPNGFIRYVAVLPGQVVTEIEIRVQKECENHSVAEVTHRRTALSAAGNHFVSALSENAAGHAAHWEQAINEALRKRRENVSR